MRRLLAALPLATLQLASPLGSLARAEEPAPRVAQTLELDPLPSSDDAPSKKSLFLREKAERPDRRLAAAPRSGVVPGRLVTLRNVWTRESIALSLPGAPSPATRDKADKGEPGPFDALVRCHFTNQTTTMDPRLLSSVLRAATRFKASSVEIVSGFRAPKYQLMLRKKGHEVARDSEHPRGQAVDFRIPEVPTRRLLAFVRSLHLGGVGYYPESRFVHADVGRPRFWQGH